LLDRSPWAAIAMLATLRAGAAFVPLDPAHPLERWRGVLDAAQVQLALSEGTLADRLDAVCPLVRLDQDDADSVEVGAEPSVGPHDLAYVMFTSGSTGSPKGVPVDHRAVCNQVLWRQSAFALDASDAVLQSTSLGFDPAVWEIFGPLAAGARVVFCEGDAFDAAALRRVVREHGVTVLQAVPSLLRALLEQRAFAGCTSLRRVFCGGEPLDHALQQAFFDQLDAELVNLYGCTETAIDAAFHVCNRRDDRPVAPIGRAIANTRLYVLDEQLQPVASGMPGELVIGGAAVARSYLDDSAAEARFIDDPCVTSAGARAFRSGDLARRLPNGELELLGRLDRQIKLRGTRIEPAEVTQGSSMKRASATASSR
jgi:amino acid adenylation domain-containing protein